MRKSVNNEQQISALDEEDTYILDVRCSCLVKKAYRRTIDVTELETLLSIHTHIALIIPHHGFETICLGLDIQT